MINYEYYEDKFTKPTNKQYTADKLAELGDWTFHPRYRRDYKKSWKHYRKTQTKTTVEKTPKLRKSKEREHWRINRVKEHTEIRFWRLTDNQKQDYYVDQMQEFIPSLEQGMWIRQYRRWEDDNMYQVRSVEDNLVKLCDGYWYGAFDLHIRRFTKDVFTYDHTTYYSYDRDEYVGYKKFNKVA